MLFRSLYALETLGRQSELAAIIANVTPSDSEVEAALAMIDQSGAVARAKDTARSYVDTALDSLKVLSKPEAVAVFTGIGEFVVDRYN